MAADPFTSELAAGLAGDLRERFLRYVRIDTTARREHSGRPSSEGQLTLGAILRDELAELGCADAAQDEEGYVTATLPASDQDRDAPVVGLIAHVDTSPDAPGAGVEPIVHEAYGGGVLTLPLGGTQLDPAVMPELRHKHGHDIVTSSGDTLLGADDKAGVAIIMAAAAHLSAHPELPRPNLRIAFTVDEEIGEGAYGFDLKAFGARCAYTIDGSEIGELQDETFSALEAEITVEGVEVHPGQATGKMVNATRLLARIIDALPPELTPERTSGRDGFIHVYALGGDAGRARLRAIVRDFDDELLDGHIATIRSTAERIVGAEPRARLTLEVREQYRNMRNHLADVPEVVAAAEQAIRAEGIEPVRTPIRGGTDGSILSARGLPTPNIFTGGHEFHSVREWASLHDMSGAAAVLVRLAGEWAAGGPSLAAGRLGVAGR